MRTEHLSSWWRQWTCIGGSCAPPARLAQTSFERVVDRYLALTAPFLRSCWVFLVVGVVAVVSFHVAPVAGLALMAGYLTVHSTYCLANFLRCREAHCIITGAGWLVLAAVAAAAAAAGQDVRREVWDAFCAVTVAGFAFEFVWRVVRGSNALTLR